MILPPDREKETERAKYFRTAGGTRPYTLMGYEQDRDGNWQEYLGG